MLITEFDPKTGLTIQVVDPTTGNLNPKEKEVDHSYLEHWLNVNQIEAQFSVAKFYEGVLPTDRLRLEDENRVLVFTNGANGYFTDPDTARLMTMGDANRQIQPIYAADVNSPHNMVAYGSLILSDGMDSTVVGGSERKARILVIDDEKRLHGETALGDIAPQPLRDRQGRAIPQAAIEKLYDKMGDGTMLVASPVMQSLITPQEREEITAKAFAKAGISSDITDLALDEAKLESALSAADKAVDRLVRQTVTQFRAATPDIPGIIKGTMTTSQWCERLGVDAIISKNDIKGDDKQLSTLGIREVEQFWLNRKSDGKYGEQRVGPQVKGCIPEATLREFNPQVAQQAEELAAVAHDPQKLLQYYVEKKERQRDLVEDDSGEEKPESPPDWLYEVAKADPSGVMSGFSKINYALEKFTRSERLDNAIRGIRVPSAMAQHHSQLEPWEVCNKDLPHGAIVAYYRSPFPNVSAAAIAINNTEVMKVEDLEAFGKSGVAYLNPWTAKNIAITDFDKDANGYFVGYEATVSDLPQQIRTQLEAARSLPPAEQYEAGRALFGELIEKVKSGEESRLKPADYPIAVEEFVSSNAPDRKPLQIEKQPKIKHPWNQQDGQTHAAATWQAWEVTANNPTGMVANISMTLQSLALETQYIADEQKEPLLKQISAHYTKLLKREEQGKAYIPTDEDFQAKNFPAYHLRDRIEDIAQANQQIPQIKHTQERAQFIEQKLSQVNRLLKDLTDGPIAENLQTAVDVAKSARGIDLTIQTLAKELAHKEHLLRQHQRDSTIYTKGQVMPTNTQEPIGWAVEDSNKLYKDAQLQEHKNEAFRDLFPNVATTAQEKNVQSFVHTYKNLIRTAAEAKSRLGENRREDKQPTLLVESSSSNRQVVVQRLCDADETGTSPVWNVLEGQQQDWKILIVRSESGERNIPEAFTVKVTYTSLQGELQEQLLGYVAPESAAEHQLEKRLEHKTKITIDAPIVQLRPPFAAQNDIDYKFKQASEYLNHWKESLEPEAVLPSVSVMFRDKDGMDVAIKAFTPQVIDRLQQPLPVINVGNLEQPGQIASGNYQVKFTEKHFQHYRTGEVGVAPAVAIVGTDGDEQLLGTIAGRSVRLPLGTIAQADIQFEGKIAKVQVLDVMARELPTFEPEVSQKALIETEQLPEAKQKVEEQQSPTLNSPDAVTNGKIIPFPPRLESIATLLDSDNPSRQELRQWYQAVHIRGDRQQLGKIIALGQTLNNLYNIEQGSPTAGGNAPPDYRHAAVTISEADRTQMKRDVSSFQAAVNRLAEIEAVQTRSQTQR